MKIHTKIEAPVKDMHCVGCYHYRTAGSWFMCQYFEDMDRMRPCPPGKFCTCYKTKRQLMDEKKEAEMKTDKYDSKVVFEMLASGMKPKQIAKEIGVETTYISKFYQNHKKKIEEARMAKKESAPVDQEPYEQIERLPEAVADPDWKDGSEIAAQIHDPEPEAVHEAVPEAEPEKELPKEQQAEPNDKTEQLLKVMISLISRSTDKKLIDTVRMILNLSGEMQ